MNSLTLRRAERGDLAEIEGLLKESALPLAGVSNHLSHFFVAKDQGTLVGAIGLELYGRDGLLRSLVVRESHRRRDIGNSLYQQVIGEARRLGAKRLVLLTTTAEAYFSARGFRRIDRSTITGPLTRSAEFNGACPTSAICMELHL